MRTFVIVTGLMVVACLWAFACVYAQEAEEVKVEMVDVPVDEYVVPTESKAAYVRVPVIVPTAHEWPRAVIIATCDPQKLLTEYKKAQDDLVVLDKQTQQARQQVVAQTQQIEAKRKELKGLKKRDDREQAAKELGAMVANLKNFQETQGKELTDRRNELLVSIDKDLLAAVQKIAKQKGINLVLAQRRSSVLYADDALDITDDVIVELNKKETE